jgi:predicted N-acyltransferase
MNVRFIDNIHLIPAEAWHTLVGSDYPFLRHEFLAALEASHSVGGQSGWQPDALSRGIRRWPSVGRYAAVFKKTIPTANMSLIGLGQKPTKIMVLIIILSY